jgi:hypothetical protein
MHPIISPEVTPNSASQANSSASTVVTFVGVNRHRHCRGAAMRSSIIVRRF